MGILRLSSEDWQAIRLTLIVSGAAVAGALPLGTVIALILARLRFMGRFWLDAAVTLPMVLPPVVVGWLLLELLGIRGVIGGPLHRWFGFRLAFTTAGAAVACAVMVLPIVVRSVRLALEAIDPKLEQAARGLGAGAWDCFLSITLPLAMPGLLVGTITAFAASIGEFGAVITFAANIPGETRTLPLAIYTALQSPDGQSQAERLSIFAILLALGGLAAGEFASRTLRAPRIR